MQRDAKIGKISQDVLVQQKVEILGALRKLGEKVNYETSSNIIKCIFMFIQMYACVQPMPYNLKFCITCQDYYVVLLL